MSDGEIVTQEFVSDFLSEMFRRCEAARSLGGISMRDVFEGAAIPDGWQFDLYTEYYVPSINALDEASGRVH